jgi:heme exporter protein C
MKEWPSGAVSGPQSQAAWAGHREAVMKVERVLTPGPAVSEPRLGATPPAQPAAAGSPRAWGEVAVNVLAVATFVAMLAALYGIFIYAPPERVQGDVQRIFYVHLSLAWLAYLAFFVVFVCSVLYLWRRADRWDQIAAASAELGVLFTTLVLVTGVLWGRPVWGVWWTWDARLTTTLVLWFLYAGYLMLRAYAAEAGRTGRVAAVVGIVAFLDVPVVQLSVTWWRTLHPQPSVITANGTMLPAQMVQVLVLTLLAFTLLYSYLLIQRVRLEGLRREVASLRERIGWGDDADV